MTHCAKCGAELIGSRRFCAACGAPAVDPRAGGGAGAGGAPVAPAGARTISDAPARPQSSPSYGPPATSAVNPFAQTASPESRAAPAATGTSSYGPPPDPPVSPLAVSNLVSQRGAFQTAAGPALAAAQAVAPEAQAPATSHRQPGTQLLPAATGPSGTVAPVPPPAASSGGGKRPERTQMMGAIPSTPASFSNPQPSVGSPAAGAATPRVPATATAPWTPPYSSPGASVPSFGGAPPSAYGQAPPAMYAPPRGVATPHAPSPAPSPAPPPGVPPSMAAQGYGGYSPGTRVQVTWADGQRYPGTVQQVSGAQCLVVFPDGQQHWVLLQYLAPG